MFVVTDTYRFEWPVKVVRPSTTKIGETVTDEFVGLFEALPSDRAEVLADEMAAAATVGAVVAAETAQVRAVLVGWSQVVDEAKRAVEFSPEALDAACRYPWFREAVGRAYREAIAGGGARLGN